MVPPFQSFFPYAQLFFADRKWHTKIELMDFCKQEMMLTEEDCALMTRQKSKTQLDDRTTWIITYLSRAGIIHSRRHGRYSEYQLTDLGASFFQNYPDGFGIKELYDIQSFKDFQMHRLTSTTDNDIQPFGINIGNGRTSIQTSVADSSETPYDSSIYLENILKAYEALDCLKNLNMPISPVQMQNVKNMEQSYIDSVAIPELAELFASLTSGLRTPCHILCSMDENGKITVKTINKVER